uniref:GDP/GTP exchange factor Sec2 N-terminal domain-containing protein n=1 Tax=Mycena chlorophos TaxID=658473 RepID=A0ABQ0LIC8_MYCCL|nr:predicted protein [Mycena chlorophos]
MSESSTKSPTPSLNSVVRAKAHHPAQGSDADAQEQLISTLRSQIQDLFSQVTQLNAKLVKSYDRVSDLEDDLHVASAQTRQSSLKISQLELERTQHLSALNTGLLVEKSQVTAELTRLMEKATEEAAQRGQAETAKANIEKDLDDLSATLFAQANTMVAEARYAQSQADRRVEEAETALKGAEEMVGHMQQQMQEMQAAKEDAEKKAQDMRVIMGKGKWVDRRSTSTGSTVKETRLLSSHLPYQEFLLFVAHLRSVHPSSPSAPAMTTLLTMPFLARLSSEDSEPTVRLDLAPSLNWLSRRSVLAAIHNGQLTIEPMSSSALLAESSNSANIPGLNSSNNNISCALCGTPIFSLPEPALPSRPPTHPALNGANANINSWSASVIKKTALALNGSPTVPARGLSRSGSHSHQSSLNATPYPSQIHVFRIASPLPPPQPTVPLPRTASPSPFLPSIGSSRNAAPTPLPSTQSGLGTSLSALAQGQSSPVYPLCTSGWCLARLRATCTLWAFVRTDVVNRVWEEEVPIIPQPPQSQINGAQNTNGAPPPVPPRRRGLWGMASKLGERAASWSGDKKAEPVPPPVQPVASAPSKPAAATTAPAPPLPRRSEGRARRGTVSVGSNGPPVLPPRDKEPALPPAPASIAEEPAAKDETVILFDTTHPEPAAVGALKAQDKRLSAHQVPLPDSRPLTPVDDTGASAATASGVAPPPIPRRAAARNVRPVPPPPGAATPRTESPALIAVPAEPESVPEATPAATTSAGTPETEERPSTPKVEEPAPTAETTVEVATDPAVVVEANGGEREDGAAEKAEEDHTKAEPEASADQTGDSEEAPVARPTADETPRAESPMPVDVGHVEEEDKSGKPTGDEDGEVYIGDVTWEERTWKELVRLREDMFWARIGAVRG